MNPIGISAIQEFHESYQASMFESNGWMIPQKYTSIADEITTVEKFVGIYDISSYVKFIFYGDNVLEILQLNFQLLNSLNDQVNILKSVDYGFSLLLGKLTKNEYFIFVDQSYKTLVMEIVKMSSKGVFHFVDMTSGLTGIRLLGPMACDVIASVSSFDLRNKKFSNMSVAQISLMKIHAYLFRIDIQSKLCYDIFVSRDIGLFVWNELMYAGKCFGIAPFGFEAMKKLNS